MTRARQIQKLRHRWNRLLVHMDEERGTGINMAWMYWAGFAYDVIDALMALGVDVERPVEEWK